MKFADIRRKAFAHLPTGAVRFHLVTYGIEIDAIAAVMPQPASRQQLDAGALGRLTQRGPFMRVC